MKLGIIGCGKMGGALVRGALDAKAIKKEDIIVFDRRRSSEGLVEELGLCVAKEIADLFFKSDVVLLCVKPQDVNGVLEVLSGLSGGSKLFISIAAGISTGKIEAVLGKMHRVSRVMPNTPALVGEGASVYCFGSKQGEGDRDFIEKIFGSVGKCISVKESMMDAVTGLSGSGPAYLYLVMEALAEAGVQNGLKAEEALFLAAQTTLGAAKMVIETGEKPQALREMVTSPGGTTLAGLEVLENNGLKDIISQAVGAATQRSKELGA